MGRIKEGRGPLLGNAGEHYVMAELLRRDIVAGLAPRNAPGIDILASTGNRSIRLRVKTKSSEADSWVWNAKTGDPNALIFLDFDPGDSNDIVALVDIPDEGSAQVYLFPTHVIDAYLKKNHGAWLGRPGRFGQKHSPDNRMRRLAAGEFVSDLHKTQGLKWEDLLQSRRGKRE